MWIFLRTVRVFVFAQAWSGFFFSAVKAGYDTIPAFWGRDLRFVWWKIGLVWIGVVAFQPLLVLQHFLRLDQTPNVDAPHCYSPISLLFLLLLSSTSTSYQFFSYSHLPNQKLHALIYHHNSCFSHTSKLALSIMIRQVEISSSSNLLTNCPLVPNIIYAF